MSPPPPPPTFPGSRWARPAWTAGRSTVGRWALYLRWRVSPGLAPAWPNIESRWAGRGGAVGAARRGLLIQGSRCFALFRHPLPAATAAPSSPRRLDQLARNNSFHLTWTSRRGLAWAWRPWRGREGVEGSAAPPRGRSGWPIGCRPRESQPARPRLTFRVRLFDFVFQAGWGAAEKRRGGPGVRWLTLASRSYTSTISDFVTVKREKTRAGLGLQRRQPAIISRVKIDSFFQPRAALGPFSSFT